MSIGAGAPQGGGGGSHIRPGEWGEGMGSRIRPGVRRGSAIRPGMVRGQAAPPSFSDWGLRLGPSVGVFFCSSFLSTPPQPPKSRLRPCSAGQGGERPCLWPLTQPRQRWPEAPFPRGALLQRKNPFWWGGGLSSRSPHSAFLKAQTQAEHRVPTGHPLRQPRHQQPHRR